MRLESIVNVIASLVAWFAIRISHKPADDNHQYGHQKAEYFSAVLEGVLVVLAALAIFYSAGLALMASTAIEQPLEGMVINGVAAAINAWWAWLLIKAGREEKSPALQADGQHIRADVVTSIGVLAGLGLAIATGWYFLDAVLAIIVGINVLYEGWKVISASVGGLMDTSLDLNEAELIEKTILAHAGGAIEVHDIKTRVAGPVSYVEFHMVVDGQMSVNDAHDICDRIEHEIHSVVSGAKTTIHVEPDHKKKNVGLIIP